MHAIVQDAYGPADGWHAAEIAVPVIADEEALVKVSAAGLEDRKRHV